MKSVLGINWAVDASLARYRGRHAPQISNLKVILGQFGETLHFLK
jgi:hypothetical protein